MAEWFLPGTAPQPAQEAVREVEFVEREWDPSRFLVCTHCNKPISKDRPGMDFTPGKSGFGEKSGRPMLVHDPDSKYQPATLHIKCIYNYVFGIEEQEEYYDDEPQFCAACDAQISGDEG